MIVIDTHILVWWIHDHPDLRPWMRQRLMENESGGIGISAISCWEIARLVLRNRLMIHRPLADWFVLALNYPGIQLIDLSPDISIEANRLPGEFHKDPADQIIVATARVLGCPLLTADEAVLSYPHVNLVAP